MSTFNDLLSKYTKVVNPIASTLIVCDGTDTNTHFPLYTMYGEKINHSQMIYPSSLLQNINISQVVFYNNKTSSLANHIGTDNTLSFKISDTDIMTNSFQGDLTVVATSNRLVTTTDGGLVIFDLNEPYQYRGGNLLVDFYHPQHSYTGVGFYGVTSPTGNNQSYMTYGNSTYGPNPFLPKIGFNQGL